MKENRRKCCVCLQAIHFISFSSFMSDLFVHVGPTSAPWVPSLVICIILQHISQHLLPLLLDLHRCLIPVSILTHVSGSIEICHVIITLFFFLNRRDTLMSLACCQNCAFRTGDIWLQEEAEINKKTPSRGIEWKCASEGFVENSPLDACHGVVALHARRTPQSVITW